MDKLTILNRALIASGNEPLQDMNDGSAEWVAAHTAFERAIDYLVSQHQWPFATKTLTLTQTGTARRPPMTMKWQYPTDCWHLRTVYDADTGQSINYRIIQHEIETGDIEGPVALYVVRPDMSGRWHPAANECLTLMVEAELWSGLNGDPDRGQGVRGRAENMLMRAQARVDQQSSPPQAKSSRAGAARRSRKI